jgi:hypothetical protein
MGSCAYAQAQAPQPAPAKPAATPVKPARVRVTLEGFDITPKSGKAPNQIGGASRDLGELTLYAPRMGKAYSLTPTFYWSADDETMMYDFTLAELTSEKSPIYTATVTGGHFTYPASAPPLEPGETYVWSVTPAVDMMGGAATASVMIVGGQEREAIAAKLEKAKDPADNPSAAQAKIMVDARVWFDALAAYTSLIASHPERAEFYRARAQLYDQLPGTAALADADLAKAER